MQYYALLAVALAPVALGCLNTETNSCASYLHNNPAIASPFCASFTKTVVTATVRMLEIIASYFRNTPTS